MSKQKLLGLALTGPPITTLFVVGVVVIGLVNTLIITTGLILLAMLIWGLALLIE